MSLLRPITAVSLCGLLLSIPAVPQQQAKPAQPQDQIPNIVVSSLEVVVPVTVTDDKGNFVSNLEAKDFRVLDEGRPQRIEFFSHNERQPVVVGFLVDLSNSSRIHWKTYQEQHQRADLEPASRGRTLQRIPVSIRTKPNWP